MTSRNMNFRNSTIGLRNMSNLSFLDFSNSTDEEEDTVDGGFSVQADVFPIALSVLIVSLNSLVIILVIKRKQLQNPTNYLLCSLAFSDLFTGLISVPLFVACNIIREITICITTYALLRFTSVSTVLHLLFITLDRYLAIIHSLRYYGLVTTYRGCVIISFTWLISLTVAFVQFAWSNPSTLDVDDDPPESVKQHEIRYDIFNLAAFFGLPLVIMVFVNGRIFYEVQRQSSIIKKNVPGWENSKRNHQRYWKAAVTFTIMFAVYIMCWLPYFLMRLQQNLGNEFFELTPVSEYILFYFRFLTSFLNPCIYILGKHDFRSAVVRIKQKRRASSVSKASTKYSVMKTTPV